MSHYIHSENVHNLLAPQKIVPEIIKILNPKSVVDFGCGIGTFLKVFKQLGVEDVLGVDGPWADKSLLFKNITKAEFHECNLEEKVQLTKKYDLVVSLEVAEHVSNASAELFVKNLINAGSLILFSAAIPNQGGQNHINEQWLSYWEAIFEKQNYVLHDVMRPIFWEDEEVFWWYKQNMVLFTPKDFVLNSNLKNSNLKDVVHYELFNSKIAQYENNLHHIKSGKASKSFYILMLLKSFFGEQIIDSIKSVFKGK